MKLFHKFLGGRPEEGHQNRGFMEFFWWHISRANWQAF